MNTFRVGTKLRRHAHQLPSVDREWTAREFAEMRQDRTVNEIVASDESDNVLGFIVYRRPETHTGIIVLRMKVVAESRRQGIGNMLVDNLKSRIGRRNRIIVDVSETNLGAQLFLKSCGFKCVARLEGSEDYRFVWINQGGETTPTV